MARNTSITLGPHVPDPPPVSSLTRFVGYHLDVCFSEVLPHYDRKQLDDLIAYLKEIKADGSGV